MVIAESEYSEDYVEFLEEIPSEMVRLYHELSLLEERLKNQRIHIQVGKTELNENEEVFMNGKYEKGIVKYIGIQRKQSEAFVLDKLIDSGEGSCAKSRIFEGYRWRRNFHISYTCEKKHVKEDWVKNYNVLIQEQIQS